MTEAHGTYQSDSRTQRDKSEFRYAELLADINRQIEEGCEAVRHLFVLLAPVIVELPVPDRGRDDKKLREIHSGVLLGQLDNTKNALSELVDQLHSLARSVTL